MLSRASRYNFQNGSGLCVKTTSDKASKHISDMTFREKREHIIEKVFVDPKNRPQEQNSPQSPHEGQEDQKKSTMEKSEVMNLLLQMRELVQFMISHDDTQS